MNHRKQQIDDTTLRIKQNVFWLQITVDDAKRMQMLNGKRQFSQVETSTHSSSN